MRKITTPLMFFILSIVFSQKKADIVLNLSENIDQIVLNNSTGIVLAEGKTHLFGLQYGTDQPIWKIPKTDFRNLKDAMESASSLSFSDDVIIENIETTPFNIITKGASKSLINSETGAILFSTVKEGWTAINHYLLLANSALIIEYIQNKKVNIALVDLRSGLLKWSSPIGEAQSLFSKGFKMLSADETFKPVPKIDQNGSIIGFFNDRLVKFNGDTGDIIWNKEYSIHNFDLNQDNSSILVLLGAGGLGGFMGLKEKVNILNSATGEPIWEEPMKVKKVVYIEDLGDSFILGSWSGFNVYNYKTGQKKWKKDPKGKPKSIVKTEGGYILISDTWMNFIGQDGQKKWKRSVPISDNPEDPIYELKETNGKIFFITATYSNIIDKATGKKIWKKNLKFDEKRPTFFEFDKNSNQYLVYNDEKLYKYGINTTERPDPFTKLKIKKEKEVNDLEVRDGGYLISGTGEIVFIEENGTNRFQHYYKEVGGAGRKLSRIGLIAGGIVAGLATSTVSVNGGPEQGVFMGKRERATAGFASDVAFAQNSNLKKRFDASGSNKDYRFFFTKDDNGNKVLIKVNKDSGTEVASFLFNTAKPVYTLDNIDDIVYYINGQTVEVFKH
ncbi:putative pyrroloquinoline-quinone binding quinoprotein [Aquimarina sp. MAR_2010_214]|uniref:PQQ-binding-like beta-propeller repeat protein n=1 Tax=Aquimarina sp. MAR_2010_214 TaxID=1250026 RepID=UPI000C6FDAB6|nr:PQQ-binding-like beta-propeller repeat protein [Aquimarina sp. MAR_2010_214]PKV49738.1 putative pyrroloquinoline-quinone binding quinoprotein [Aquimarina sp. MAR_2010_214]